MRNACKKSRKDRFLEMAQYNPTLYWLMRDLRSWMLTIMGWTTKVCRSEGERPPFLFIVGAGRSGNTLLRRMMMERLSIYIPPETYALPRIADYRIRARGLPWPGLVDLTVSSFEYYPEFETFGIKTLREFAANAKKWNSNEQSLVALLMGLYSYLARESGLTGVWLGDKTPLNTLQLKPISKIIPGAFYVYLLRDGVDVASSYVQAGIYKDLPQAADRWVRSHKSWLAFRKRLHPARYIELRYEELVVDPEKTIEKIANLFGIPFREERVNVNEMLGDVAKRKHHGSVLGASTSQFIGKGRDCLSKSEKRELRPVFGDMLARCGYDEI